MSHYAEIDENNRVIRVIVAEQDFVDQLPGQWIQTSYNTRDGIHYGPDGQPDGGVALRGNYAAVGWIYNAQRDIFHRPQPFASWQLTDGGTWIPPIPVPVSTSTTTTYIWNESIVNWEIDPYDPTVESTGTSTNQVV